MLHAHLNVAKFANVTGIRLCGYPREALGPSGLLPAGSPNQFC
jgi:hypothetical protein